MDSTLSCIIYEFRIAQDRAVATIRDEFKWKMPPSNREWVDLCISEGYYQVREMCGLRIYAHGYGIEIIYPDLTIDFDWGECGEATGFDTWRLWNHCQVNHLFLGDCTYELIDGWLSIAYSKGALAKDRLLYYRSHEYPMQRQ